VKPTSRPPFCATCTDERADLVLRGEVWLCPDCDPSNTRAARRLRLGPERGYDVPDAHAPIGATHRAFAKAAKRVAGPAKFGTLANGTTGQVSRPGFITIRVPRCRADGTPIDAAEARATLSSEPWFEEVQHRGSTRRYHLFDRPDVELAREVRGTKGVNAMDELRDAVAAASAEPAPRRIR